MKKKYSACPSWLDLSTDRMAFVFVKDKADIVRKVFDLCIGGLGSYTIANQLNRQGVPTLGPSPTWDHSSIDNLLKNRATLGEHQQKSYAGSNKKGVPIGAPIPGYYPAVIDEKTFIAAQEARRNHLRTGRGRKGNNLANLFTGLTTCRYCGSPVKFHSNNQYKSLICEKALEGVGCVRVGWSYANFESSVLNFLCHPALLELRNELAPLSKLIQEVKQLDADKSLDIRLALAAELKRMIAELRVTSGGESPIQIHSEALLRRDHPARFFEIRLRQGASLRGLPI